MNGRGRSPRIRRDAREQRGEDPPAPRRSTPCRAVACCGRNLACDDPTFARRAMKQPAGFEVLDRAAVAVQEDERRTIAQGEIVKPDAIDLQKAPGRRTLSFRTTGGQVVCGASASSPAREPADQRNSALAPAQRDLREHCPRDRVEGLWLGSDGHQTCLDTGTATRRGQRAAAGRSPGK
jgi:hypothetical protein